MWRVLPALLLAVLITACGTSKTQPPAQPASGVRVSVSADWGTTPIATGVGATGTVIDATRGVASVTTAYGGRYVTTIGNETGDGSRDWIFWLNGVEAPVGGADLNVAAGDHLWWDIHRWTGRLHVPAVVAAWPRPLTRGFAGTPQGLTADPPLAAALTAFGARVQAPARSRGPRAVVGSASALVQRDGLWRRSIANPAAAGLTAWIDSAGVVRVWNANDAAADMVPAATAVIVATTDGFSASDAPVVFVAGITAAAATQAATALATNPTLVANSAAICLDAVGHVVCRGGIGVMP